MKLILLLSAVAIVSLTVAAIGQVWSAGGPTAILGIVSSGIAFVAGMRNGIDKAPSQNWDRRTTKIESALVLLLLLSLISIPAVLVGVFFGFVSAISSFWITLVVMAATSKIMEHWFGVLKRTYHTLSQP